MGGGGEGGDGGVGERLQSEEARKRGLRNRISQLYGYDADKGPAPTREKFTSKKMVTPSTEGLTLQSDEGGQNWVDAQGRIVDLGAPVERDVFDEEGYNKALGDYNAADDVAAAARGELQSEEDKLAGSTRDFYGEDLKHTYDRAKRNNTFALADRGLLGGTAQVDTERELNRDNTLGATRLEDEVRAAVASLKGQREGERLNALSLVNSGAGEEAVSGAKAGLSRAIQNASATRKASIASDLFTQGADAVAGANDATAQALALQRYQQQLRTFFNPTGGGAGRVTATT